MAPPSTRVLDLRGVFQVPLADVVHGDTDGLRGLGVIRCFGFDTFVPKPVHRRKIPGGAVKIVLAIDGALNEIPCGPKALVVGLRDRAAMSEHHGRMCSTQVVLHPLAAGRLLGVPMGELRNRVVSLDELVGKSADLLIERVAEAPNWQERFSTVNAFLRQRAAAERARPADDASVAGAVRALHQRDGRVEVSALAAELGISRRHLSRLFSEHIGLSPKTYSSLLRFSGVLAALVTGESLATAAAQFGYHDQAHLNRHFHRFAQCTPSALLGPQ